MAWRVTAAELEARLRGSASRTRDDVTITWDGRRLDTKEAVLEWLREIEPVLEEYRARGEIMPSPHM